MTKINVPSKLLNLMSDDDVKHYVTNIIYNCEKSEFFSSEHPYFFPEYTKHGYEHINRVLYYISVLIPDLFPDSIPEKDKLSSEDVATTILGAIFHDAGMFINPVVFVRLLNDSNFYVFDRTKEAELSFGESFLNYIDEVRNWFAGRKSQVFGELYNEDIIISLRDWNSIKDYGSDFLRLFIGEFIRRFHHEISLRLIQTGFDNNGEEFFGLKEGHVARKLVELIGTVAYSHGVSLKNAEKKIEDSSPADKQTPRGVHIYYAMSLVRLADYLDAGVERASMFYLNNNVKYSAYSKDEFVWNQCVTSIELSSERKDELAIDISYEEIPNPTIYNKLLCWVEDLNSELDTCWAVLGRKHYAESLGFTVRNIASNILDLNQYINSKACKFYPKPLSISFNNELLYTLAKRLYDNDLYCGIRELLQNSVDACRELKAIWSTEETYKPQVAITYNDITGELCFCDNGVGMDIECIENCYLAVGKSFSSIENKPNSEIYKTGQFGIGFLAAFLLSDEVRVVTKQYTHNSKSLSFSYSISKSNNIEVVADNNHNVVGTQIEMIIREQDRSSVAHELECIGKALINTDIDIQVCLSGSKDFAFKSWEKHILWHTAYMQPGYKILFSYDVHDYSTINYTYYNGVPYKNVLEGYSRYGITIGFVDLHRQIAFSINRNKILNYSGGNELVSAIEENIIAQYCNKITSSALLNSFLFPDGSLLGVRGNKSIVIVAYTIYIYREDKDKRLWISKELISNMFAQLKKLPFYNPYYGVHIERAHFNLANHPHPMVYDFNIGNIKFYTYGKLAAYEIPTFIEVWRKGLFNERFPSTTYFSFGVNNESVHGIELVDTPKRIRAIDKNPERYVAQFSDYLIPFDREARRAKFPFIDTQNSDFYNSETLV